jgi:hypothetical protein
LELYEANNKMSFKRWKEKRIILKSDNSPEGQPALLEFGRSGSTSKSQPETTTTKSSNQLPAKATDLMIHTDNRACRCHVFCAPSVRDRRSQGALFFAQNPTLQSSAEAFAFPGSLAFFCSKIENSVYDSSGPISSSNAQPTHQC